MVKFYCDICKGEIKKEDKRIRIKLESYYISDKEDTPQHNFLLCQTCFDNMAKFIKDNSK